MSDWVEWDGSLLPSFLFVTWRDEKPGSCPACGGLGVVPVTVDEERFDVAFPCHQCKMFCQTCKRWVHREGHAHAEAK